MEKEEMEKEELETKESVQDSTEPEGKKKGSVIKSVLIELCIYAVIFVVCIWIMPRYVYCRNVVTGSSMCDTLQQGDHLITEKVSYELGDPKRFDVVVLEPHVLYSADPDELYVKRVIGLPGETIEIKGNDIFINGKKLEEHYGREPIYDEFYYPERKLGDDEYFVMGDNRNVSRDSRDETVGPIRREYIQGKVVLRIWPLKSFSVIK